MEKQIERFRLKPFANMLDAGGATGTAYHVPKNAPFWLVVVDGEGKIAFNASRGWHWSSGPDKGKFVHQTQVEASLAKHPGILGVKEIPSEMRTVAHYFDLQQFLLLEAELKKAETKDAPESSQHFAFRVRDRVEELRKERAKQIEALVETDPLQAYREAESFVAAFPAAPEKAAVTQVARNVSKLPAVRKELQAEGAYRQVLVPEMQKAKSQSSFLKKVEPLLDSYLKAYSDTHYAEIAKGAVDAHGEALSRAR